MSYFEETFEREVKPFGSRGSHITLPKKYIGRVAVIKVYKKFNVKTGNAQSLKAVRHKKGEAEAEIYYEQGK